MKKVCFCNQTDHIVVEVEVSADPVWCGKCQANLELSDFPVSEECKKELIHWNMNFEKHLMAHEYNGVHRTFIKRLNEEGQKWTQRLREELPRAYTVSYRPYTLITED
ncbi:hypothetical protein [Desmospora profundinema]|uniref:Amidophosphoribosyltransferase n=1 Tax=Desmospora profundinema TaxID=1571184 RepID=A0ABU1IJW6_9BACL|nr:hypothetical protein [Desmospora profundinema]MDR6225080.1 putative amidophosphoribosyltransferase [Desmospora profundinema]